MTSGPPTVQCLPVSVPSTVGLWDRDHTTARQGIASRWYAVRATYAVRAVPHVCTPARAVDAGNSRGSDRPASVPPVGRKRAAGRGPVLEQAPSCPQRRSPSGGGRRPPIRDGRGAGCRSARLMSGEPVWIQHRVDERFHNDYNINLRWMAAEDGWLSWWTWVARCRRTVRGVRGDWRGKARIQGER